ncbi:hypothetical protein GCM10025880_47530 [Methylorubrum aminovorans]|nr:hypothetical protein GCM10025880_47530 [Methylorubrum aminovorans]
MSQVVQTRRLQAVDLIKRKAEGRKIIALTAYHAHTARIVDAYCDFVLVGDSSAWSCTVWNRPCR